MDMIPFEAGRMLATRLTAEQWNAVLAAVNELPHRVARPIYDSLMAQLREQSLARADEAA